MLEVGGTGEVNETITYLFYLLVIYKKIKYLVLY
jgi:hypothetical protein